LSALKSVPPANDSCGGAATLTFVNGTAQVEGDTSDAGNDATTSCGLIASGANSSDVVYTFTTPVAGASDGGGFIGRFTALSRNATEYAPAVYVRTGCLNDAGSE